MDLDAAGDGAERWVSELVEWRTNRRENVSWNQGRHDESDPALIADIPWIWVSSKSSVVEQPGAGKECEHIHLPCHSRKEPPRRFQNSTGMRVKFTNNMDDSWSMVDWRPMKNLRNKVF